LITEYTPRRLCFEIEYSKPANPEISDFTVELLLEKLLLEIKAEFVGRYGLDSVDFSCVVDLDSITASSALDFSLFYQGGTICAYENCGILCTVNGGPSG